MNTNRTHSTRRRRAKTAAGLAVALGALAFGAAPAGAAPVTGSLNIYKFAPGEHCFQVEGRVPMNQYDAQGYINNGAFVDMRVWGDDPGYDDFLLGPVQGNGDYVPGKPAIHASSQGIEVRWWACTPSSTLNEDWGGDEVYVGANVHAGGGAGWIGGFETRRFNGSF
jgi:hypothetical protein